MDLNGSGPSRFNGHRRSPSSDLFFRAYPQAPPQDPSSSSSGLDTVDGELHEDDIFTADFSHASLASSSSFYASAAAASASSSSGSRSLTGHGGYKSQNSFKAFKVSGILAALPEPSGHNLQFFKHKATAVSNSVSSAGPSLSSSSGDAAAASACSSSSSARTIPSIPRPPQERIPFPSSSVAGGNYNQSAPVNVPVLSQAMTWRQRRREFDAVDLDEEEEEGEMLPPHEIVARSLAQSPMLSCSVLEGAGRTLKGRDLRQVRNAIFRQTGFID